MEMESEMDAPKTSNISLADHHVLKTDQPSSSSASIFKVAETKMAEGSLSKTHNPTKLKEKVKSKDKDGKPRVKRPYKKSNKRSGMEHGEIEKPPPKKRGRKSKKDKELLLLDSKFKTEKPVPQAGGKGAHSVGKSPTLHQKEKSLKSSKRSPLKSRKKASGIGPMMFDKRLFTGPHLTMKQVLEYILTDHSYCVPPDPLPAVGSNHQMIRFILGPKNGAKAQPISSLGMMESGEKSPIAFPNLSRSRGQLALSSTPPPSSKLENLLKRGDASPLRVVASKNAMDARDESDVEIDIESVDPATEKRVAYDVHKAREVMNECEKYVKFARDSDTGENWESNLTRTGWTKVQNGLFDKVVGALHAERLSRLAFRSIGDEEPVLRRASLDKTAWRVRRIFGEYLWDTKLTQWLHGILNESLNFDYLAIYLDVLQTLKCQCPQLVSRMMKLSVILPLQNAYGHEGELSALLTPYLDVDAEHEDESQEQDFRTDSDSVVTAFSHPSEISHSFERNKVLQEIYLPERSVVPQMKEAMVNLQSAKNAEALKALLGRQWDPFAPVLLQRLKKLSSNPVFIFITPGSVCSKFTLNRRLKHYERMFRRIGQVLRVRPNVAESLKCTSATSYLERIMYLAKEKIRQARQCYADRPLYLVGWGSGSILAARLSATSGPVDGVIALGFPLHSLREMQEEVLKTFNGIKHPVLFVIGGLSSNNCLTDMEVFRKRLACETSLVVVGCGSENLYITRDHREKLLVTQSYVDKNIVDEIAYFVNLHSKHNQIIAANISMKPQFSKSQNVDIMSAQRHNNTQRSKKRKSSFAGMENDHTLYGNNEECRTSYDNMVNATGFSPYFTPSQHIVKRDLDSGSRSYEYDFDGPKFIPSKSSNKRKPYYKPDSLTATAPPTVPSSSCLTASQLVQQSPNAKRRISKPSGSAPRTPLLGQPSNPRSSLPVQASDMITDDSVARFSGLSGTTQRTGDQSLALSLLPSVLRQPNGAKLPVPSDSSASAPLPLASKDITPEKPKKKQSSKSKSARVSRGQSTESPTSAIVSAMTEVTTPANVLSPPTSLDLHKFVLQHQQILQQKQSEKIASRPQSSQLLRLLSPAGSDSSASSSYSPLPLTNSTDIVKLKLIGSQQLSPGDLVGDGRTAVISKQSLVTSMTLPMIRIARSGSLTEDSPLQKPVLITSSASPGTGVMSALPSDVGEKIFVTRTGTGEQTIKLNELKQFITAAGRPIQMITAMAGQGGPVNIVLKKSQEPSEKPYGVVSVTTSETSSVGTVSSISTSSLSLLSTIPPSTSVRSPVVAPLPISTSVAIPNIFTISNEEANKVMNVESTENKSEALPENAESTVSSQSTEPIPDCPVTEDVTEEAMDVDTDDEMSGIKISSTFSVCPTSGERVDPAIPGPSQVEHSEIEPASQSLQCSTATASPISLSKSESDCVSAKDSSNESLDTAINLTPTTFDAVTALSTSKINDEMEKSAIINEPAAKAKQEEENIPTDKPTVGPSDQSTSVIQPSSPATRKIDEDESNVVHTITELKAPGKETIPDNTNIPEASDSVPVESPVSLTTSISSPAENKIVDCNESQVTTPLTDTPTEKEIAIAPSSADTPKSIPSSSTVPKKGRKRSNSEKNSSTTRTSATSDGKASKKPIRRSARLKSGV